MIATVDFAVTAVTIEW